MEKPVADLASFQQTILASLPAVLKPIGFQPQLTGVCVTPDVQVLKDDLDHIDEVMGDCFEKNDKNLLSYAAQFLNSLGRDANSKRIVQASKRLELFAQNDTFSRDEVAQEFLVIRSVVDNRLAQVAQVY